MPRVEVSERLFLALKELRLALDEEFKDGDFEFQVHGGGRLLTAHGSPILPAIEFTESQKRTIHRWVGPLSPGVVRGFIVAKGHGI